MPNECRKLFLRSKTTLKFRCFKNTGFFFLKLRELFLYRVTENPLANQVEQQTQNQVPYQGVQKTENQVSYQGGTQVPYQGGINLSNPTTVQFNPNSETSVDLVVTRSSNYSQRDSAHNNQSVNHAGHDRTNQPRQSSVYSSSAHKDLERVEGVPTDRNHDTNYASHHSSHRRHQLAHDKNQW